MATKKTKSIFQTLDAINVNDFTKTKGNFTYLSWSDAVTEVLKEYPEATWEIHEFYLQGDTFSGCPQPYMSTESGCFVKVSVTINELTRTEILPIMDNRNQTMLSPKATDVNDAIKRCLTKCFSLFGLGLYIYRGENLPEDDKPKSLSDTQVKEMQKLVVNKSDDFKQALMKAVKEKKINTNNYDNYISQIKDSLKKPVKETKTNE